MKVKDIMTKDPICCLPTSSLKSVAQLMVKYDCGEIPVVYSMEKKKVIGVITDRDICCRTVARGLNPLELTAEECMSTPAQVITGDVDLHECCDIMEEEQIRRMPVVEKDDTICGMISLADIVMKADEEEAMPVLKHISEPRMLI